MKPKRPCLSAGPFCISTQAAAARWQKRGKSKKIAPVKDGSDSRWQRKKDSNPHKRSQSPVCYHYTIPLRTNDIIQIFSDLSTLLSHIFHGMWRLSLSAKELISSDALIFLRRNGGKAMKYECLKLEERRIIEEMYAKGAKPGEIAERVGKCQATIYRELERGKTGETDSRFRQGYSAAVAEARVNRSYRNRGRRKAAQ